MRIIAFAYACEPGRGSEPGAGWRWAHLLAELGETWVITRANNRPVIQREIERNGPLPNVHFVYVDLPPSLRRWKRGQRGVRLYYLLWQRTALREARRLASSTHLILPGTSRSRTVGSDPRHAGSTSRLSTARLEEGSRTPWRLAGALGVKGVLGELLRAVARRTGRYVNPIARASWRRASLILVQNQETKQWLPHRHRSKAAVFPNLCLNESPLNRSAKDAPGDALRRAAGCTQRRISRDPRPREPSQLASHRVWGRPRFQAASTTHRTTWAFEPSRIPGLGRARDTPPYNAGRRLPCSSSRAFTTKPLGSLSRLWPAAYLWWLSIAEARQSSPAVGLWWNRPIHAPLPSGSRTACSR